MELKGSFFRMPSLVREGGSLSPTGILTVHLKKDLSKVKWFSREGDKELG